MPAAPAALPAIRNAPETVADLLLHAAQDHPKTRCYFAAGLDKSATDSCTYADLQTEAQRVLRGLRSLAPAGSKVVLLLDRPRDFVPVFWACVLGGFVPCPVAPILNDPERWSRHLAHIDQLLERPLIVSNSRLRRELPDTITVADANELRGNEPDTATHPCAPDDIAILMLTSGSTGNAKAVALKHFNLLASMAGKNGHQRLTATDVTLNWIAFDHVAALLEAHLLPIYVGATQVHVEPTVVLDDPLNFLRLIDSFRVSMTFTPNFLLAQINNALSAASEKRLQLDLSCLRHIISGGEAIVVETGRRFLDLLAPHGLARNALWPAFGMTETCAGSVYSRAFPDGDVGREFAYLGLPIREFEMRIVDDHGAALPAGMPGELQLRGPMVFTHYYNNPEATSAAFTADGWFRSGDIGCLNDGRLSLVGRNKDSIIVNGVNYFSHELETTLEQLQGIERSFVAAFPTRPPGVNTEQLVVLFASSIPPQDEERLYQLLTSVRNTTIMLWGFRPSIILHLPKNAFAKTSLGKIQRSLLRKQLEAGEFSEYQRQLDELMQRQLGPHTRPQNALEQSLLDLFAEIFKVDPVTLSTTVSFFDLGGTSMDILKLTQALEERFGMQSALPAVLQNPTVQKLAATMTARSESKARSYDPLVPLQMTGRKTPLFCVHPGNGEVLILVNLAKYFVNERPFYALRPRGFNPPEECFKSFDEMVDIYRAAIVARQPEGPYAIAGYSLGAPIAFEIAKRMQAEGRHIAFLGCIDGPPCEIEPPFDRIETATGLGALLELIDKQQARELKLKLRGDSHLDPCAEVLKIAAPERVDELDLDLPRFSTWATVAEALENILRGHVTSGSVPNMSIFLSAGIAALSGDAWHERIKRWSRFVERPVYTHVAGEHYTLMAPRHVATFQDILRTDINRALNGA